MNFAESWQHLVPTFNSPAVFIPAFKVSLQAGHFVNVFQDGYFLVGRIIGTAAKLADISNENPQLYGIDDATDYSLGGFVKLNWFRPRHLLNFSESNVAVASHNQFTLNNIELFQTKEYSWLHTGHVVELCFVFNYNDVVDAICCCEGMSNAFFVRYRYAGESLVEPISKDGSPFLAFPCSFPTFSSYWSQCLSSEVWECIIIVQQAITSLLCRYSQTQGRHPSGRSRVSIPAAVMFYLQVWFTRRNIFANTKRFSRMQKHI
jgi:hypothetical protein